MGFPLSRERRGEGWLVGGVGALRQAQGERIWECARGMGWNDGGGPSTGSGRTDLGWRACDGVGGCVGGGGRPLAAHLPWVPAFAGTTVGVAQGERGLGGARA